MVLNPSSWHLVCSSHQGCGVLALSVHRGWKHMHAFTHLYTYTCIHICLNPCTYTCICTSQNYEFTSISPVSKPSLQGSFLSFPILCFYLPSSQLRTGYKIYSVAQSYNTSKIVSQLLCPFHYKTQAILKTVQELFAILALTPFCCNRECIANYLD